MQQSTTYREPARTNAAADGGGALTKAALGAVAGAVGTVLLDRVDWLLWDQEGVDTQARTTAARPHGKPPADVLVRKVEEAVGVELAPARRDRAGFLTHVAMGIAPAAGYALVRDKLPGQGVVRGAALGLGMFLLQDELLNSVTGLGAKPREYPWQDHARGLVAHLLYGVTTELTLGALERSMERTSRLGQHR